jgi:trehalose/maltose hydrolase-like predicted phosphorylase
MVRRVAVLIACGAVLGVCASAQASTGSDLLRATARGSSYAPTFTGNGFLGVRVPPAGQGYAGGTVPAQSELAGFYAKPTHPSSISQSVQQRANIPTWSTLSFVDAGQPFSMTSGTTRDWQQTLDLHTGVITTTATWTAPDGHTTGLDYSVFTDRADPHVAVVSLTLTPHWSGTATVTDLIDGSPASLTDQTGKGFDAATRQDYVAVTTQGTAIQAAISSVLATTPNITAVPTEVDASTPQSVGQQVSFPVVAGQTYAITKYVGVDDSQDAPDPVGAAQTEAATAAATGYPQLRRANDAAWAALWTGRIDVLGDPALATDVNASEFYLWADTRAGVNWSISPAGLSSNGYDGHIFWDAETWMYPSLLAQHPDLAVGMDNYRFDRLAAAQQHAQQTGYAGARFPWESALDGTEQIPPPVSINSEGLYEQHITADIALAQWQYYLVSGDRSWLAQRGWPVLSQAAAFWASRVTPGAHGSYHIRNVTGPDEENPDVTDEVYTNVAAKTTLQDAIAAARVLGAAVPGNWSAIAAGLVVPVGRVAGARIHPEFSGYRGQLVKQADVTLLQYPWLYPMPRSLATSDINFYVPRSDPGGPSMNDAVNSIDASTLGTPGCSSYVDTVRSIQPFIRDVFDQFSETRYGGAFTFMTGIGGFLQEFLYGYSGLRWEADDVRFAPSLSGAIGGVRLTDLSWRGRTFSITVGRRSSTMVLSSGAPMPVRTAHGLRMLAVGAPVTVPTARPDLTRTPDAVRCGAARASSSQPGAPALAAVDGSPATDWEPARLPATLTLPLARGRRTVGRVTISWGRLWPLVTKPNVAPVPGPVRTLRASDYAVQVSVNGRRWRTVARVRGVTRRVTDVLRFRPAHARFLRVVLTRSAQRALQKTKTDQNPPSTLPQIEELTAVR